MVRCFREFGHEIRVISARDQALIPSLDLEIPESEVLYTSWFNVNLPVEFALGGRGRVASKGYTVPGTKSKLVEGLGRLYKDLLHLPDGLIGWYPFAVGEGKRLLRNWQPDIIYASATPYTSLLVAKTLASVINIPWVGELRDLWIGNPYISRPAWRRRLEETLEERVLHSARGLVTVSDPLAQFLRKKYACPVEVVTNAYDPEDHSFSDDEIFHTDSLEIIYTGMIYEGRRDPSPLFKAISQLNDFKKKIKVKFYGRYLDVVTRLADQYNISEQVELHPPVSRKEALKLQAKADVLLLLLWDDPSEAGTYTGKLFEYIGSRRPVLTIGPENNVASQLIINRHIGIVTNKPDQIAAQLQVWIDEKEQGGIPMTPFEATKGMTRAEQAVKLDTFLKKCKRGIN